MLYLPLACAWTFIFVSIDIACVPFAYFAMTYKLFKRVNDSENMQDVKIRGKSFLKFLAFGPFILIGSIFIDTIVFFYNLYTTPPIRSDSEKQEVALTEQNLDLFEHCVNLTLK